MKKLGKQVHLIHGEERFPRSGEGAFIRLKDGRIMYAFTKYYDSKGTDHDTAYIAACYSSDEGEHFSEDRVLLQKDVDALNIMSVTLLRMANGDLGIVYLEKRESEDGVITCMPLIRRSTDEGVTFSDAVCMVDEPSYYVLNNDRVIRLKSGRILFAVADHRRITKTEFNPGSIAIFYSDDDGRSFKRLANMQSPINDGHGFLEPGLYELPDGRVWLYIRTNYGYQYMAFSSDNGISWTTPVPNYKITSPSAPMLVKAVGEFTVAIFNPMPWAIAFANKAPWGVTRERNPFVMAVSTDGGESLVKQDFSVRVGEFLPYIKHCYYIEDDRTFNYSYPAILEVEGGFLVAYYYISPERVVSLKIKKISFEELRREVFLASSDVEIDQEKVKATVV